MPGDVGERQQTEGNLHPLVIVDAALVEVVR